MFHLSHVNMSPIVAIHLCYLKQVLHDIDSTYRLKIDSLENY